MSTTIRSDFAREEQVSVGLRLKMADVVRVYAPGGVAGAPDLIVDLQQEYPGGDLHRLGFLPLSRHETELLVRALIREGDLSDFARLSVAHLLLSGITDDLAPYTDGPRAEISDVLNRAF